jgi:hypothetical protein
LNDYPGRCRSGRGHLLSLNAQSLAASGDGLLLSGGRFDLRALSSFAPYQNIRISVLGWIPFEHGQHIPSPCLCILCILCILLIQSLGHTYNQKAPAARPGTLRRLKMNKQLIMHPGLRVPMSDHTPSLVRFGGQSDGMSEALTGYRWDRDLEPVFADAGRDLGASGRAARRVRQHNR